MKHQEIIFSNDIDNAIHSALSKLKYNKIFLLTDINTEHFVLPQIAKNPYIAEACKIVIKSGDMNKNIESLAQVWKALGENGATRRSLLINLGGGVVTDLGGFAASTFKRGIDFVNIPTTLLGAVDAAIGGKTGINFNGLKNEIGIFNEAKAVIISTIFLKTLPLEEIKSGYAEMLKHGLLSSTKSFNKLLDYDFTTLDIDNLLELLKESVQVKSDVVKADPTEKGIRRALNLGHTAGHAFESLGFRRSTPIPHGYAVAWGIVVELVLSHIIEKFDSALLNRTAIYIYENYGAFNITCDDYAEIITLMSHDKKSNAGELNFTLLSAPGKVKIDCVVPEDEVKAALDIYRDLMHI